MTETPLMLITSAAYVSWDMISEFGKLPPAFLPLGNRRLYEWQLDSLQAFDGKIALSLPESFECNRHDQEILKQRNVTLCHSPDKLSLAQSISHAISTLNPQGAFSILHGDTLIEQVDLNILNIVTTGMTDQHCRWAEYTHDKDGSLAFHEGLLQGSRMRSVISGYFSFSNVALFQTSLKEKNDFIEALNAYHQQQPLTLHEHSPWYDFGHANTYYLSRGKAMAARSFNQVNRSQRMLKKSSSDKLKIRAEANWFEQAPGTLRPYLPQYIDHIEEAESSSYRLEYLHIPPLNDLYVFGRLPDTTWESILTTCFEFIDNCGDHSPPSDRPESDNQFASTFHQDIIISKSWQRIEKFLGSRQWKLEDSWTINGQTLPTIGRIIETLLEKMEPAKSLCFYHGDFCFSNIFYDFRSQNIRVIDPRGMLSDGSTAIYGDSRYDMAKLLHSVLGYYDYIVAGRASCQISSDKKLSFEFPASVQKPEVEQYLIKLITDRAPVGGIQSILAMTALLFFSMLPLHADCQQRQLALFANGLRLYRQLDLTD